MRTAIFEVEVSFILCSFMFFSPKHCNLFFPFFLFFFVAIEIMNLLMYFYPFKIIKTCL